MSTPDRTDRILVLIVGLLAPLAITFACVALMVSWIPTLPSPIAIHWGPNGVDGVGSVWVFILMPVGILSLFCLVAFLSVSVSAAGAGGAITINQKFLLTTGLFLSVFLGIGMSAALESQRGLADAADAPDIALPLLLAAAAGVVLAAVGWFILPEASEAAKSGVEPMMVPAEANERLYWGRSVTLAPVVALFVGLVVCAALATGFVVFATSPGRAGLAVIPILVVTALVFFTSFWRVSVDRRAFTVRAPLGWPRIVIPNEQIEKVQVVDIDPSADFGGWGWRWAPGRRTGIILRRGQGIEITRHDGRRFVVTVNDAAVGAGVAKTLATRARASS
jgi:hypothetical protein